MEPHEQEPLAPSRAERILSAAVIGIAAVGFTVSVYVVSESFSNVPVAVTLGLVGLAAVPDIMIKWRNMTARGQQVDEPPEM